MDKKSYSTEKLSLAALLTLILIGGIYASGVAGGSTDEGLVAEYRFDTGASDTAYDTSGNNNEGTINGASWTEGRKGKALSFDGKGDDYIAMDMSYSNQGALSELTSCVWIKTTGDEIYGIGPDFDRSEYFNIQLGVNVNSGKLAFSTTSEGGSIDDLATANTYNDGEWHHVCAVYDSSKSVDKKLYVNGKVKAERDAYSDGTALGTGMERWGIIGHGSESNNFDGSKNGYDFPGKQDEIRLYETALNKSEIRSIYNSGSWKVGKGGAESETSKVLDMSFQHVQNGQVLDTSGNSNHGTIENGAYQAGAVECKVGRCFRFDGNDDYLRLQDNPFNLNKITVTGWINSRDVSSGSQAILSKTEGGAYSIYLNIEGNNKIKTYAHIDGSYKNTYSDTALKDNKWYHVAYTFDGSTSKLFVNGKKEDSVASTGDISGTDQNLLIGAEPGGNFGNFFNGKIDHVKIYNRSLSQEEIWKIYSKERSRSSSTMPEPVAHYPMQTESAPLRDISGEGNHGDLNLLGESGTFKTSDGEWKTIRFERNYKDPIVVGTPNTHNGEAAIYFEVKNVDSSSASMRLCESEGGDNDGCDTHGTERAGYVIIDAAATDDIPGIEAGGFENYDANGASYSESFSTAPVVFTQPQTDRAEGEVVSWTTSRSTSGFNVQVCQQDSKDGCSSPDEEIGWVAVEPSNEPFEQPGEADDLSTEVGSSNWASTSFSSSFSNRPVGVFSVQNNDGGQDPKVDEIRKIDTSGMEMRFCELNTGDTCDGHKDMEYAYLAVSEGLLTYTNGNFPRYVDTSRGKALEFDGSDDEVRVPHKPTLSSSKEVTVATWVRQEGSGPYQRITDKGSAITYWVDDAGDTCVRLTATEGGGTAQTCFSTDIKKDEWHHMAFNYDSSEGEVELYVNGELFGTSSYYSGEMSGNTADLFIGSSRGSRYWNGKIDDVRIYPYALNQQQIKQVKNSGSVTIG